MGATSFEEIVWTEATAHDAYLDAVDRATCDFGSDPYNGTISTTSGVEVYSADTPVSVDEALRIGGKRIAHISKWGPCEAIRVYQESDEKIETILDKVTATVRVDSSIIDEPYHGQRAMVAQAAQKHLDKTAASGAVTGSVRDNRRFSFDPVERTVDVSTADRKNLRASLGMSFRMRPKVKTTTEAPKVQRVTRYFIIDPSSTQMPSWDDGFASQSDARSHLPKELSRAGMFDDHPSDQQYEIIAITRREEGLPLVAHKVSSGRKPKTVEVEVTYGVEKIIERPQRTGRTGWFFYGMAAT